MNAFITNKSYRSTTNAGFTLIELMVTIAVLAIIVSIAAPNISTQLANQRVKSTTATLTSALKEAKVQSVIRRQPLLLDLDDSSKAINMQHVVSAQIKTTLTSYQYSPKTTIKSDSTSMEFKPSKTANAVEYTICDSNNAANPIKVEVSATAIISTKSEGTCP